MHEDLGVSGRCSIANFIKFNERNIAIGRLATFQHFLQYQQIIKTATAHTLFNRKRFYEVKLVNNFETQFLEKCQRSCVPLHNAGPNVLTRFGDFPTKCSTD